MNYDEAINYIHSTPRFASQTPLKAMSVLMEKLSNPQDRLRFVHVAGTNGKGSTVAFLSEILKHSGAKTGMFTSPFITRFNERIMINGVLIPDCDVARIMTVISGKVEEMKRENLELPTEFELVTAMAFVYFNEEKCDIVVLEVGLGGRLDATNVIKTPLLSIITTLSMDHVHVLGDTIEKIAYEKACIIKKGGDVLLYPQCKEAEEVITNMSTKQSANLITADFKSLKIKKSTFGTLKFDFENFTDLEIHLIGTYQPKNAAMALLAAILLRDKGFSITGENIRKGLKNARWAGRFEILRQNPTVILDGAHNEEGAKTLAQSLTHHFGDKKIIFVVGILMDKDAKKMIQATEKLAKSYVCVSPDIDRAIEASELKKIIQNLCKDKPVESFLDIGEAIENTLKNASSEDVICVYGSLYFISFISFFVNKY